MFYKVSRIVALVLFAALIIIPSAIVVMGSSKTDAEVYNKPLALPERWTLDNFRFLLREAVAMGYYNPVDYSKNPFLYCGKVRVTNNPYY